MRIILAIISAVSLYLFFMYESFDWTREVKFLVVEAKASYAKNGTVKGAFLIYREVGQNGVEGEPKTVLVDGEKMDSTNIGDTKVEFVRSRFAYIMFVTGVISLFFLIISINPDFGDILDSLFDAFS